MIACFAGGGVYTAIVDVQIAVDVQLSLTRLYQMLFLCGLLWALMRVSMWVYSRR